VHARKSVRRSQCRLPCSERRGRFASTLGPGCWHGRSKPGVGRSQDAALAGFGSEGGLKVLSAPKTSRPAASTAALSTKYAAAPSAERVTHGPGSCRRTQTVTAPASVSHSIAPVLPIRQTPQSCASILKRIDSDQASASASGTTEPHDVYCTQPVTRSRPLILAQYQARMRTQPHPRPGQGSYAAGPTPRRRHPGSVQNK